MSWRRVVGGLALATVIAGVVTVTLVTQSGGPPQTAFARAQGGQYAVVARNTGAATVVTVLGTGADVAPMDIATVPHLSGFSLRGTVSPDGRQVAIIAPDSAAYGRAFATLITLNLETGELRRLAEGLEPLQDPLWTPDSTAVLVTRNARTGEGVLGIAVMRVGENGTENVMEMHPGALMVAPVGLDAEGRLLAVRLDARGSTLTRGGDELRWLSRHITRDWALSPDALRLAFVEANTWRGLRYLPRVVWLESGGAVAAASLSTRQALGSVWTPSGDRVQFGAEPYTPPGSVSAASGSGFDVPLGFSRDGKALAVRHWSGGSFEEPGVPELQIVNGADRYSLEDFTRFFGWSAR